MQDAAFVLLVTIWTMNVSGFPDVFTVKFASICPVPDNLVGDIVMQVVEFPSVSVLMSSVLSSV